MLISNSHLNKLFTLSKNSRKFFPNNITINKIIKNLSILSAYISNIPLLFKKVGIEVSGHNKSNNHKEAHQYKDLLLLILQPWRQRNPHLHIPRPIWISILQKVLSRIRIRHNLNQRQNI